MNPACAFFRCLAVFHGEEKEKEKIGAARVGLGWVGTWEGGGEGAQVIYGSCEARR